MVGLTIGDYMDWREIAEERIEELSEEMVELEAEKIILEKSKDGQEKFRKLVILEAKIDMLRDSIEANNILLKG